MMRQRPSSPTPAGSPSTADRFWIRTIGLGIVLRLTD